VSAPVPARRRLALVALLVTTALLPACNGSTPSLPSGVLRSAIQITVNPNPIPATLNTLTGSVTASYQITVAETAGLGGQLIFVSSTVLDPLTGAQVVVNYYDANDLVVFVGTQNIAANGTLLVPQSVTYILPDYRTAANLTIAVQFKDDRGNLINQSILVTVV